MIKYQAFTFFISFLIIVSTAPIYQTAECEYGLVQAWFRTSEGDWENATAHPLLTRGEPFEIKINLTSKTILRVVYLKLHEFGTPVYEVITGPSALEQLLEDRSSILSHQSSTYIWRMRVRANTLWVNGTSPLEVYVQFTKNDYDDESVSFDVINAFIMDELWEHYTQETSHENVSIQRKETPQLSSPFIIGIFVVLFLIGIFFRGRRKKGLFQTYKER
jgi:sarcinarray family protein